MPRPKLGVKPQFFLMHPDQKARVDQVRRLRKRKGDKNMTFGQTLRDVIEEGLKPLEKCLQR